MQALCTPLTPAARARPPPKQVEGAIPSDLAGTYLQLGPGLSDVHGQPIADPADGDGLAASIAFKARPAGGWEGAGVCFSGVAGSWLAFFGGGSKPMRATRFLLR